jgi:PEP-CTERM motif
MQKKVLLPLLAFATVAASSSFAATYNGNGATGFGGAVGNGSVSITDTSSSMTVTFNRGLSGNMDNDLVLYLDTQPGGFSDTSQFSDTADGGRTAISGFNSGNPSRTVATFASGFQADYAISIENSFIGVFGLAAGGNNSLNFLFGTAQSGVDSDASYSITLTAAQMAQIGLIAGSGQSFLFVGSEDSDSAYRANETIGNSVTTPDNGAAPNGGFNGSQLFTQSLSYQLGTAPEPSTLALLGIFGAGALFVLYRRRQQA